MKIGILPGSFNPVHIGHLALANYLAEYEGYDSIWFVITPYNLLKNKDELIDKNLRLKWLSKAVEEYGKFKICKIEWSMSPPFYTIDTLQKLKKIYTHYDFELIIGADNGVNFHYWKNYQIILKNFKILIYPRKGYDSIYWNHPNVFFCKNAPKMDISATFVRRSTIMGKEMRFLLPKGIYEELASTLGM